MLEIGVGAGWSNEPTAAEEDVDGLKYLCPTCDK
tara:strand:+ start:192 stop:293 length:102 start_codon:yes stop_codon:yes gene_type:complete